MRTIIAMLLGGWLFGTVLVGAVTAENFFMVDRLLNSVESSRQFLNDAAELPPGEARLMLRHLASELNRFYFQAWEWIELVLGGTLLVLAFRKLPSKKLMIGFSGMLGIVLIMSLYITPEMIEVGRQLDFVPRDPPPPGLGGFGFLHGIYSTLDLAKLIIGIWTAVVLARLPSEPREPSKPS